MAILLAHRRRLVALIAGVAVLAFVVGLNSAQTDTTLPSLASTKGRYFGSATDNPEVGDAAYVAILGRQFGQITPGNSMKWDTIEPVRGTFGYTKGDAVVALAQANGRRVRGRTRVWHTQRPSRANNHTQRPSRVNNGGIGAAELDPVMPEQIATEATHDRGQLYARDVVNEQPTDQPTEGSRTDRIRAPSGGHRHI